MMNPLMKALTERASGHKTVAVIFQKGMLAVFTSLHTLSVFVKRIALNTTGDYIHSYVGPANVFQWTSPDDKRTEGLMCKNVINKLNKHILFYISV